MKTVLSCTNRSGSKTSVIAQIVFERAQKKGVCHFMDLQNIPLFKIEKPYEKFDVIQKEIDLLNRSSGVFLVFPEYNGSFPGFFKYFLDHWHETKTFKNKVFFLAVVGSTQASGLQALRHLQGVLLHRRAFIFPEILQVHASQVEEEQGKIDPQILERLQKGVVQFFDFCQTLEDKNFIHDGSSTKR